MCGILSTKSKPFGAFFFFAIDAAFDFVYIIKNDDANAKKESDMITATIKTRDGETFTETFDSEIAARNFCIEEVKWESTARVTCPAIKFDQPGDFA